MDESCRLRINVRSYNAQMSKGNKSLALTYVPEIKKSCEILELDWKVLLGIESGYIINDLSVPLKDKIGDLSDSSHIFQKHCMNCGNEIKGKRADAKFCSDRCKRIKNKLKNAN